MFNFRHRLQEAVRNEGANGGNGGNGGAAPADWLKPFGEHAKVFDGIKDPAELATKFGALNTEVTTLKAQKPGDWRKTLAGDDAEALKGLERYTDPKTFLKTFGEAQTKIRSGELAKPLAKDAKPEEVAAWRQANGIPAEPKGYFEKLPDGLVIGEDDKALFDDLGKLAHDNNVAPQAMHGFVKWYYDAQAKMTAEEQRVDHADKLKAVGELRTLWGADYDANMKVMDNWLEGMGAEGKALFMDATLGDGTRLFNNVKAVEFLAGVARAQNPLAHLIPGNDGGMKTVETELAEIEKLMGNPNSDYWKGPKAAAMQKKYLDLTDARLALQKQQK